MPACAICTAGPAASQATHCRRFAPAFRTMSFAFRDMARQVSAISIRPAGTSCPAARPVSADTAATDGMKPLLAWLADKERASPPTGSTTSGPPEIYRIVLQLGRRGSRNPAGRFAAWWSKNRLAKALEAVELNRVLHEQFAEAQIYRIDHYWARRRCRTSWCSVSPTPDRTAVERQVYRSRADPVAEGRWAS